MSRSSDRKRRAREKRLAQERAWKEKKAAQPTPPPGDASPGKDDLPQPCFLCDQPAVGVIEGWVRGKDGNEEMHLFPLCSMHKTLPCAILEPMMRDRWRQVSAAGWDNPSTDEAEEPPSSTAVHTPPGKPKADQPNRNPAGPHPEPECPADQPPAQPSTPPRDCIINFGKHKGKPIRDIPTPYLRWMADEAENVPPDLRATIAQEVRARDAQVATNGPGNRNAPPAGTDGQARSLPPAEQCLLSAADLAKLLGISLRSVWRMRDDGRLPPPLTLGPQTLRWDRDEIMGLIKTRRIGQAAAPEQPVDGRNGDHCQPMTTDANR